MNLEISVIIPAYNEEKSIEESIKSLANQSYKKFEVIVVDDGSGDKTVEKASKLKEQLRGLTIKLLRQNHKGPGLARNHGAQLAQGNILVFVDADMTFDKDFLEKLVEPINKKLAIGTFSKEEYVLNKNNIWSKCWNINKGLPFEKMHPDNYPSEQAVFRAILKSEFDKVGGFDPIGYIDDYTLSEKLGIKAVLAKGAIFYHQNPSSLVEVFNQARWIGKSEYKRRKIKNENLMRAIALIRYSLSLSVMNGLIKSIQYHIPQFLMFKIVYDLAIEVSLLKSFIKEQPNK